MQWVNIGAQRNGFAAKFGSFCTNGIEVSLEEVNRGKPERTVDEYSLTHIFKLDTILFNIYKMK